MLKQLKLNLEYMKKTDTLPCHRARFRTIHSFVSLHIIQHPAEGVTSNLDALSVALLQHFRYKCTLNLVHYATKFAYCNIFL